MRAFSSPDALGKVSLSLRLQGRERGKKARDSSYFPRQRGDKTLRLVSECKMAMRLGSEDYLPSIGALLREFSKDNAFIGVLLLVLLAAGLHKVGIGGHAAFWLSVGVFLSHGVSLGGVLYLSKK